ncbi:MAG TPA: class D sortase [Candidatus Saccharimonadales bacterium]|nr:class D sortase [Candidatus Saccharimonadales bacterium]
MLLFGKKQKPDPKRLDKVELSYKGNLKPPLMGLLATVTVIAVLNIQWFYAQVLYDLNSSSIGNTVVSAVAIRPNKNPTIYIPKLNVKAPIIFGVSPYNEDEVQLKLREGVVHYNTTALPGHDGNVVIFGHSSGQLWSPGHYKYIFTLLDKLKNKDEIAIDYKNVRYLYRVTGRLVVKPTDFTVLKQPEDAHTLSLITCTPIGVNKFRLVITARQVSPKSGEHQGGALSPEEKLKFERKFSQKAVNLSRSAFSAPF